MIQSNAPNTKTRFNLQLILFGTLFLISGCAGLVYEIVWEKMLELYFGVTMVAITLIVAAYMGGLGLGSLLGGRIARRSKSLFLLYGSVEIGIGLFGLASPRVFEWIGRATAGSPYAIVFLLSFCMLLVPTFLMGMTLPLLSQGFVASVDSSGRIVGLLYGINTLGAALGSLLAGYILIGFTGLDGALWAAVVMNIAIGLGAILINRFIVSSSDAVRQPPAVSRTRIYWKYPTILFAAFLTGFIGLGYEMLWVHILSIINKNTAYNFPTILGVYLFSLAMGGYFWGRKSDRVSNPVVLFCKLELFAGILAGLFFTLFWLGLSWPPIASWLRDSFANFQKPVSPILPKFGFVFSKWALIFNLAKYFLPVVLMVMPASLIMGGGLPVLDKIAIDSPDVAGRRVGDIHLANILGSVAGTLVISFILLPGLGSEVTLKILVGGSLAFPLLYVLKRREEFKSLLEEWLLATLPAVSIALIIVSPGAGNLYLRIYETGTGLTSRVRETSETVLALTLTAQDPPAGHLWIGGEINSQFPTNQAWEIPSLLCSGASRPHKVLIIGMGGGHTANFFAHLPEIEQITVVELIPDLTPFLEDNFSFVQQVAADPRVRIIADDGRRYLYAHPDETFDLISIDPFRNYTAGHNNLYSVEAQTLYLKHLTRTGVLCAWQDEYHILSKTTATVFPYVDNYGGLSIASPEPINYDYGAMVRYSQSFRAGTGVLVDPAAALRRFVRDRAQILADEIDSPILTDSRPLLEYYFFRRPITIEVVTGAATRADFLSRIEQCDAVCQSKIK